MKVVHFFKLPRTIQDRFVGSAKSGFAPSPIAFQPGGTHRVHYAIGASAVAALLVVGIARFGFGSLTSGLAIQGIRWLAFYTVLLAAFGLGLVYAFTRAVREKALPYPPGIYLFPSCLVDARTDTFAVFDIARLSLEREGKTLRISAEGRRFEVPYRDGIEEGIREAQEQTQRALASGSVVELSALDPLQNPRFSSPVSALDPYAPALAPWGRRGPLFAVIVAAALGPLLWGLRNRSSDAAMFAEAERAGDAAAYRMYLARGTLLEDVVRTWQLPRAEVRELEMRGNADDLVAYRAANPSSSIRSEIDAAVRSALLAELDRAKAKKTRTALEQFARHFPNHGLDPEFRAAWHEGVFRELEAYRARAPKQDRHALAFAERLFSWAETHSPAVEVRFRPRKSESLARADKFVSQTSYYAGEVSHPSRYFDDAHWGPHQQLFGSQIATKLEEGLSSETFDIRLGSPLPDDALPPVAVPTLFVTTRVEWSGLHYPIPKPRGAYIGVHFLFDTQFVIPGDTKPFSFKTTIARAPSMLELKALDPSLRGGRAEESIYRSMTESALATFRDRLMATWVEPPK